MEKPPLAFPVAFPGNATTIVAFHVFVKLFFGEFTLRSSVTVFRNVGRSTTLSYRSGRAAFTIQ